MSLIASMDSLRNDLMSVKNDLAVLTDELASLAQTGTQEAKERLFARIAVLQSQASVLQSRIRHGVEDGVGYVDDHIHAHPYKTAILAGLVGGILTWLVTRPRD